MSINVPTISVTSDINKYDRHNMATSSGSEDNSDSNSNDINYNSNVSGAFTDVEDFDSNAEFDRICSRRSSRNSLFLPKGNANAQGDVTDVEDYNDSEFDEEDVDKSSIYPESKLSLEEFLQHDVQENLSTTNGVKEMVKHKSGNFLKAQNFNDNSDYLTDYEEYNTDSEIETKCEKSAFVDLDEAILEQGKVNIADIMVTTKDLANRNYEYEDVSAISDISDLASAVSDVMEKNAHGLSEEEVLGLSENEEICQISCSDSEDLKNGKNLSEEDLLSTASLPPIDVTFIQPSNRANLETNQPLKCTSSKRHTCKEMFLKVEENKKEEVLTDIERFDDSVAEDNDDSFDGDDENQLPIPQAVILAIGDDGVCQTDCEDFLIDDISEATASDSETGITVENNTIPLPHREIVVYQEDKYGDTITNVMPMNKEYQFGIYATLKEECFTDTEEFSCAEDDDIQELTVNLPSRSLSPNNIVMVESDVTVANEILKSQQSKRLEIISNAESVTDVEEIFMAGTNSRRKKVKTRNMSRNKSKYLDAPRIRENLSGGVTDIEDMDLSESELQATIKPLQSEEHFRSIQSSTDKVTDVEEMTADDTSSMSEIEPPPIDSNYSNLKDYDDSSKNCVISLETCETSSCIKQFRNKQIFESHFTLESVLASNHNQQQHTDIEDVQLPSDAEECPYINEPAVDAVCQELNEILNECCTTIHDKSINNFNVDAEKLHIKGMLREAHTDIEYVESDESAAKGSK